MRRLISSLHRRDFLIIFILIGIVIILTALYISSSQDQPPIVYDSTQKNYHFPPELTQFPNQEIPQIKPSDDEDKNPSNSE